MWRKLNFGYAYVLFHVTYRCIGSVAIMATQTEKNKS